MMLSFLLIPPMASVLKVLEVVFYMLVRTEVVGTVTEARMSVKVINQGFLCPEGGPVHVGMGQDGPEQLTPELDGYPWPSSAPTSSINPSSVPGSILTMLEALLYNAGGCALYAGGNELAA